MKKILGFVLILSVLFCQAAVSENNSAKLPEAPYRMVAPVFGTMAANQIFELWKDSPKNLQGSNLQIVIWENDAGILVHDVMSNFYENKESRRERKHFIQKISFIGISTTQDESDRMALRNKRFPTFKGNRFDSTKFDQLSKLNLKSPVWAIFICSKEKVKELESAVADLKGKVLFKAPSFELEFLKSRRGRQVLDLGSAKSLKLIYDRLIARSVNPLEAKKMAQRSIDAFHADKETMFVIVQL